MARLQFVLKDGLLQERLIRELEFYDMHIDNPVIVGNPLQTRRRVGQLTLGDFA